MNQTSHGFGASLFHPDFGDEPVGGKILVGRTTLQFQSETISIEIPLVSLEIEFERGGKGFSFYDASFPDVRIYMAQQSVLRQPAIKSLPQITGALSQRDLSRAMRLTGYFLGGAVLVVIVATFALGAMTRALAARVPVAWEERLGSNEIAKLRGAGRFLDDSNSVAQLSALAAPLTHALPEGNRHLQFFISGDTATNAFALPGGYVVVNAGLLQMATQPEELLGVLAHELAHQTKRHVVRRSIAAAGPLVIFGVFLHSSSGAGNLLSLGSGMMVFQGFSQDYETEADDTGWSYMVAANIDPRGMIHAFQKIEAAEDTKAFGPQALQSHPATAQRIARLEKKWTNLSRKSGFLELPPLKWNLARPAKN